MWLMKTEIVSLFLLKKVRIILNNSVLVLSLLIKGELAGQAAVKAVGKTIAGGAGAVAIVAGAIGIANAFIGNNGFQVTMTFKWTHFEHKIQGIDLYDWGLSGVKVVPY